MSSEDKILVMGGKGTVGGALVDVFQRGSGRVYILDKGLTPIIETRVDFLHVAIPYTDNFVSEVKEIKETYAPRWIVIHSTVPVGTTRKIGVCAAHSPVRGQHNDLSDSLLRFPKYVGSQTLESENAVLKHFGDFGVPVIGFPSPESTELAKLLCLSRYLNDLAFYEVAHRLCTKFNVPPDIVKSWTSTYNSGYKDTKWVRPNLEFPRGYIGGTCVLPVSEMLAEQADDPWLKKNVEIFREKETQIQAQVLGI